MIFDKSILIGDGHFYIGTDWHIGHTNIIGYDKRPDNYEQLIIDNIQKTIKSEDIYINLGDVVFKDMKRLKQIMPLLPGKHFLTMGNHDREKPQWYINSGFSVVSRIIILEDIVFSHRPINLSIYPGCVANIHGHFHKRNREQDGRNETKYDFYNTKRNFCLFIDDHKYMPTNLLSFIKENGIKSRLK